MASLSTWCGLIAVCTIGCWLGLVPAAFGQKAPAAGYVFPAGGRAGTTVEVQLGGYDWTPDIRLLMLDPRTKLEGATAPGGVIAHLPPYWFGIKSMVNDPPLPREVSARLVLPADLPAGPIRWCAANANGGSPCSVFIVGHGNEILEDEGRRGAQELTSLPMTVNGRLLKIEEVDTYRFLTDRSGIVTCELMARRLGSDFHGVIEIRDPDGRRIAEAVDTEGVDPALTFFATAGQKYTVAVRDFDYRGYRQSTYRLTITDGPRVLAAIPAAGCRGETRRVEFVGMGVATGNNQLERVSREVTFPAGEILREFVYTLETAFGSSPGFPILLSNVDEQIEPDADESSDWRLLVPSAMTGWLDASDVEDRYTIAGHKGDVWNLSAEARSLVSPLDLTLTVIGPDGKELASNDDAMGTTDARLLVNLVADGDHVVVVTDVSGVIDGQRGLYRLLVDPACSFQLRANGVVNAPTGSTTNMEVAVIREGGCNQPIELQVTGLPAGVSVPGKLVIEPTDKTFKIPLQVETTAPAEASLVTITATATWGGQKMVRAVVAAAAGNLVNRDPNASLVPVILVAPTLKPPFRVKPVEADGGRRVHRGATYLAELIVERDEGFTGEIVLDMAAVQSRHRQGIHGSPLRVGPSQSRIEYPVFLPECLETARTSRLALVALATIRDGAGQERCVLAPMDGQITMSIEGALMKLSHTAGELTVPIGQSFMVPLKLARSLTLAEAVSLEWLIPAELTDLIVCKPLAIAADQRTIECTFTTSVDPRLVGHKRITARATAMRAGFPVVSETEIEIEFAPLVP
jgi:hypothetical protein